MIRRTWWPAVILATLVGCVPTPADRPPKNVPEAKPADTPLSAKEMDKIKELPEADRQAALAQKVCPISGEHLGSMGVPIKVSAKGKTGFVCCKGCVEEFEHDPDAALAKLKK